jgi:hypothetical protein
MCIYIYTCTSMIRINLSISMHSTHMITHTHLSGGHNSTELSFSVKLSVVIGGYPHGLDPSFRQSNSEVKALHEGTIETGGDDKPGSEWAQNPRKSHRFSLLQTLMGC